MKGKFERSINTDKEHERNVRALRDYSINIEGWGCYSINHDFNITVSEKLSNLLKRIEAKSKAGNLATNFYVRPNGRPMKCLKLSRKPLPVSSALFHIWVAVLKSFRSWLIVGIGIQTRGQIEKKKAWLKIIFPTSKTFLMTQKSKKN